MFQMFCLNYLLASILGEPAYTNFRILDHWERTWTHPSGELRGEVDCLGGSRRRWLCLINA